MVTTETVALICLAASFLAPTSDARALRAHFDTTPSDDCGFLGKCTLRNSGDGTEVTLHRGAAGASSSQQSPLLAIIASNNNNNNNNSDNDQFTIHCETSGNVNKMTYTFLDKDNNIQHELHKDTTWVKPWLTDEVTMATLQSSSGGGVVAALAVQVVGATWTTECFAEEFTLISAPTAKDVSSSSSSASLSSSSCAFSCPFYSQPKPGIACPSGLSSCECHYSYKLMGSHCVKAWCYHDFQCPPDKERIPGIDCYSSMRDCRLPRTATSFRRL